ncbi:MAG: glutathione S-transferase N-terminal domain-containing protein [Actinomycetota bacterium]|jgi:GST-like protein|nr:glutathione S-transferase N-terminal domain-containing protein [Rubrobacter sp.]MDQ3236004.1 glutathione S-transferase N-terminal domain-containing protein [Actinomycetota bacterium]MDQ3567074.1 glutathione S-transferase N-terminal domain-containing protein [Actinomycetota bacterium]
MTQPIDLYYWPTPNGKKISIFLEEAELPYNIVPINIGEGDQFDPQFLEISPNNKMPAIIDPEGPDGKLISLFESGAILHYLAEKTGRFLPQGMRDRYEVMQWLMFQMAHVGPMLGQAHHFRKYSPEEVLYAIERYTDEAARIYGVLNGRFSEVEYVAGGEYTIADMAIYPWLVSHEDQGQSMDDFPDLKRWFEQIGNRPAVQRGMEVGQELRQSLNRDMDDKTRETLFGNRRREGN